MNPRVTSVSPLADYQLLLTFDTGEHKQFDVKPYLTMGIFKELQDLKQFATVHLAFGTITWDNGADFCPDTLYEEGK